MGSALKVGVVARTDLDEALDLARRAIELLSRRGAPYFIEADVASKLSVEGVRLEDMDVDVLLAIGGDGTILRTLKKLRCEASILGVKLGKICFLGEVEPEELEEAVDRLVKARFYVEEAMKLRVGLRGGVEVDAVNEVAVVTGQPAKVVRLRVSVGGINVYSGLADGVIVATPTGSTGYAMSAHGPIVDPSLEAFLLVLLNPLNLSYRPLVASAAEIVEVEVGKPGPGAVVVVDGEVTEKMESGGRVRVWRSPLKARFIRFHEGRAGFYRRLGRLFEARTAALEP